MGRKRAGRIVLITLLILALFVVTVGGVWYVYNDKVTKQAQTIEKLTQEKSEMFSKEELERQLLEAADTASAKEREAILSDMKQILLDTSSSIRVFRKYFPEDLVVVSDSTYYFLPIRDDLKKHSLVTENLIDLGENEMAYGENGVPITHKGIDVSEYQGNIDWEKVAADGVEYVFVRTGYRGYKTAKFAEDKTALQNIRGAADAGLNVGVYFFSQAINEEEAREEAEWVMDFIEPVKDKVTYPIAFDVEKVASDSARMNKITPEERTKIAAAFLDRIEEGGYHPLLYGNLEMFGVMINFPELEKYDKWYAWYDPSIYFPYNFDVWQYSDSGKVDGISGNVDLNMSFVTYND